MEEVLQQQSAMVSKRPDIGEFGGNVQLSMAVLTVVVLKEP
jgi:hypothetical protein